MANMTIVGTTKLKSNAFCPFCNKIGKQKGDEVEVIMESNTNIQYIYFACPHCKEQVLTR